MCRKAGTMISSEGNESANLAVAEVRRTMGSRGSKLSDSGGRAPSKCASKSARHAWPCSPSVRIAASTRDEKGVLAGWISLRPRLSRSIKGYAIRLCMGAHLTSTDQTRSLAPRRIASRIAGTRIPIIGSPPAV